MPQQHQVQAGDTVSGIAKRFNVRPEDVSGFRSNDPNVIFPGETLNIQQQTLAPEGSIPQQGQVVDGSALQAPQGQNVVAPTPEVPAPTEQTGQITPSEAPQDAGAGAITETIKQSGEQPEPDVFASVTADTLRANTDAQNQILADADPEKFTAFADEAGFPRFDTFDQAEQFEAGSRTFTTPSGAEVTTEGEFVNPPEEQLDQALGQFGISGEEVSQGFQTNPFGTISDIVQQVMQATGLPDTREQVTSTANEIEDLENERDRQIADIQDDPFSSVSSKRQRAQNISDAFDKRINSRVNKLTLLQSGQETARRQAQFAATTAINLFGQQQEFQADEVERILDREEKQLEAERGLAPLKTEQVGDFTVLRDIEGNVISTIKPSSTSGTGGGFASSIEGWANLLSRGQGTIANVPQDIRNNVVDYLNTNSIDIKKQLSPIEVKQLTQSEAALESLDDLRGVIQDNLQFVGPISGLQRFNPWSDARKAQADIDRVRQTVGKTLEGGVLRKEDEEKYKKILATLGDTPETALYKIDSLVSTLQRDMQNFKEETSKAGRFIEGEGESTLSAEESRNKYNY
jgi:hypothetical protein